MGSPKTDVLETTVAFYATSGTSTKKDQESQADVVSFSSLLQFQDGHGIWNTNTLLTIGGFHRNL